MEKVYLPVNFPNALSVLLMWFLGMTLAGFIYSAYKGFQSGSSE